MKKVRGYKRRLRQIEKWKQDNIILDMECLQTYQRDYARLRIYPWNGFSENEIRFCQPKGIIRLKIIDSLIDIYDSWKKQLEQSGQPFYLKIWLFESNVANSQVVCSIGNDLHSYDQAFYNPDISKKIPTCDYGKIACRLLEFNWNFRWAEYGISEDDYYKTEKKWFENEIKKSHRIFEISDIERIERIYMIKKDNVFIGEKNKGV
ncbi:hypothetical protein FACS1894178_8040 [Bacteroidia bacterium]|nr:hypothetical protein FACS1894178_8040 [Bacteroidia bacterium]